jgi:hypothetical protein
MPPVDDVAGAGDGDFRLEPAARELARLVNFEQLGMERAIEEVEYQLGDFGTNGEHEKATFGKAETAGR